MKYYSGIDEAGLGPILGAYCASSVSFKSERPLKQLLEDQQKKLFYVDDSKKVYKGKNGFEKLEQNVLSFYTMLQGYIPASATEFIPSLKSDWNLSEYLPLPVKANSDLIYTQAEHMKKLFINRGITLIDIKRTAVSPKDFNTLIDNYNNKSTVCQKIIEPLILSASQISSDQNIIIDKQGGRKFYKEYLDQILDRDLDIIMEENNHSHYQHGNLNIHFMAKADSNSFPVALASMFSKYMREISMINFNSYWSKILPTIKKTAGYYTDGMRFIEDLKHAGKIPMDRDSLVRKR